MRLGDLIVLTTKTKDTALYAGLKVSDKLIHIRYRQLRSYMHYKNNSQRRINANLILPLIERLGWCEMKIIERR